jgi:hypothetical protein
MKDQKYFNLMFFHYERTGDISDVMARRLFVDCHEYEISIPRWLMLKVIALLKTQDRDYSLRSEHLGPSYLKLYDKEQAEERDICFMLQVDQLLAEGFSQEKAIEKARPGSSFTPQIKKYRKLKEIYGDFPPEQSF